MSFNSTFFGDNKSAYITMTYAIMSLLGPSNSNQEWSRTKAFAAFLDATNAGLGHLQDAKSSRFGKIPEFCLLIGHHYK